MSASTITDPPRLLQRPAVGWPRPHRPILLALAAMALLGMVSLIGLLADVRQLDGVAIWWKPFKFAVSVFLYLLTLWWLTAALDRFRRTAWWLATLAAVAMTSELLLIVTQVLRGQRSHFNVSTPTNAAIYDVMGGTVLLVWLAHAVLVVLLLIQRLPDRSIAWAIRAGALVSLGGMALGALMTRPTPHQRDLDQAGLTYTVGAHSVGVADGSPGLPVLGWSTAGGDLRIGHFLGLHALQLIPLFAFALSRLSVRLPLLAPSVVRTRLVAVAAAGWAALTALTTWQALRGQPLLDPDRWTLLAGLALAAAVAGATWWSVRADARADS